MDTSSKNNERDRKLKHIIECFVNSIIERLENTTGE